MSLDDTVVLAVRVSVQPASVSAVRRAATKPLGVLVPAGVATTTSIGDEPDGVAGVKLAAQRRTTIELGISESQLDVNKMQYLTR